MYLIQKTKELDTYKTNTRQVMSCLRFDGQKNIINESICKFNLPISLIYSPLLILRAEIFVLDRLSNIAQIPKQWAKSQKSSYL